MYYETTLFYMQISFERESIALNETTYLFSKNYQLVCNQRTKHELLLGVLQLLYLIRFGRHNIFKLL